MHGVQDATVDGLQAVADIRESAADQGAHGVRKVGFLGLGGEGAMYHASHGVVVFQRVEECVGRRGREGAGDGRRLPTGGAFLPCHVRM